MTANPKKFNTSSDDIDLIILIERSILFFKKYKWVYITAIILGISTGIFVYRSLPRVYTSTMAVHSFLLTNQEQIEITENWNSLLRKAEYQELSGYLNCNQNILPKVKKIKAAELQKVFTGVNPHGFSITVDVTDNSILDELQKGFVYGFENSEYVKERLDFRKARVLLLIDETTKELQKLDSSKKMIEGIIAGKIKGSSSLIIDAASANRQLIEMNEKLLGYKEELKFNRAVQVLHGFSKFSRPTNPKLIPWLVIGLAFFLSLAGVYSLISSINAKIKYRAAIHNKVNRPEAAVPV